MFWQDHEWVMISAIEHYAYCPRQCALIHIDQIFEENLFTLRGKRIHESVDLPKHLQDAEKRSETAVPLVSYRLGLVGKADIVEFNKENIPYPIEYKHGYKKRKRHDDLQLCAQAICLEEMLHISVPKGAIYHFSSRQRREVILDESLREEVNCCVSEIRGILSNEKLPSPVNDARCKNCSLINACMPEAIEKVSRKKAHSTLFIPLQEAAEDF